MRWQLDLPEEEFRVIARELFDPWKRYISSVSSAGMAVSPFTAAYLMYLCRTTKPKAVCDLGSGFSTYVFLTYAQESGCEVVSVDDNAMWAFQTVDYLADEGLKGEVVDWSEFREDSTARFDLVFHDLGGGEVRNEAMPFAAQILNPRGFIVFDDAHHEGHARSIVDTVKRFDLVSWSLERWTLDKSGRFAYLGRKP